MPFPIQNSDNERCRPVAVSNPETHFLAPTSNLVLETNTLKQAFVFSFSIPDRSQNNPTEKVSYPTGPGLIPDHSIWDLWWSNLHRRGFPQSTSVLSHHCFCTVAPHLFIDRMIIIIFATGSVGNKNNLFSCSEIDCDSLLLNLFQFTRF
jgi:hypothetical protein